MAAKKPASTCPTCDRSFKNAGGLASHRRLAKDSRHVAARGAKDPTPEPTPAAPPAPTPKRAPVPGPEGSPEPEPEAPPAPTPPAPVPQQEAGPVMVTFQAPQVVKPLGGDPQQEAEEGPGKNPETQSGASNASPTGELKAPQQKGKHDQTIQEIPLEPFIAASVATMSNGFFLRGEHDGQVTRQEVAETGFPKALEVSVRKYYPDLPLDHPFVLVALGGSAMVALVASKKAPKDKDADVEPETAPEPAPKPTRKPAPQSAPEPEPEATPETAPVQEATPSKEADLYAALLAGGPGDE